MQKQSPNCNMYLAFGIPQCPMPNTQHPTPNAQCQALARADLHQHINTSTHQHIYMKPTLLLFTLLSCVFCNAQQVPSSEIQIKTAVLAAPAEKRENAMVYGYSDKGEFQVLRKGTNDMVCLADDPAQTGFSVSCYHK